MPHSKSFSSSFIDKVLLWIGVFIIFFLIFKSMLYTTRSLFFYIFSWNHVVCLMFFFSFSVIFQLGFFDTSVFFEFTAILYRSPSILPVCFNDIFLISFIRWNNRCLLGLPSSVLQNGPHLMSIVTIANLIDKI